jgi:glutathione synthase/RimK-type ligase-like ATP-grasp enzyme
MKKIGILFGQERSFPMAFIERINSKGIENILAEPVRIDKAVQGAKTDYAVIIDRISQDVPFYRTWLKNAALTGTAVINNPFWWSADDKFFNNCLMTMVGVPVPKQLFFHLLNCLLLLPINPFQILLTRWIGKASLIMWVSLLT